MTLKVLVADDHGVVRKALRLLLEQYPELAVIGEAANGRVTSPWPTLLHKWSSLMWACRS